MTDHILDREEFSRPTCLVAFDLDHTLFKGNSTACLGRYLYHKKVFTLPQIATCIGYYLMHKWCGLSLHTLHTSLFNKFLRGFSADLLAEYIDDFLRIAFATMPYPPAMERFDEAKKRGHHTLLLSNSPDFIVAAIAGYLGCSGYYASKYTVDDNGRLDKLEYLVEGKDKARFLLECAEELGISMQETTAYSDSILDLPFLNQAGRAVAVTPDRALKRIALQNRWEII
ncbi:HAD family phosphatase [Simkania negevensis]|uniref:HAD family phosphatase n=1 Tax=Simkania negevensis TaxID=83561 RepID=A0ABS3AQW6_9BACT|nr:HAD family phosphatase [Simkania negevensis]